MAKRVSKAARKKRIVRVVLIIVIVLAILAAIVGALRKRVTEQVNEKDDEALTATVTKDSISTTVSGSGNLADEDGEEIKLHGDVEIEEIMVESGDIVEAGDLLATVNMSTVLSAMGDIQTQLDELDDEIGEASGEELEDTVSAAVAGRIMKVYASKGDDVSTVMYENGALALLSLDGYMAVKIETETLSAGDTVTVTGSDNTTFKGTVETASNGNAVILISDEKSVYDDTVTVTDKDDKSIGSGKLYIHEMMRITGIAGTVEDVNINDNQKISADSKLFTLTDVSFSANYNSLLEKREELEEQLQQLITIYQDGAILAPIAGTVSEVENTSDAETTANNNYGMSENAMNAMPNEVATDTSEEKILLSICPGTKMTVSISVDELDILSLEEGQSATISVDALENEYVEGTVTEINTDATSSNGVTAYSVTVTFDKTDKMLTGMSASVSVVIEGVDDALVIPSDALTQTSATSYVYTEYNEETGELGGIIEVTAGMNNGDYVEITAGLSEGDTIYYFEKEDNRSGFPFGDMGNMNFGGGQMPNFGGGQMPDFGGGQMPGGFDK